MDDTMTSTENLISFTAAPLEELQLEHVPRLAPPAPAPATFAACAAPQSVGAEQFRRLAVGLLHARTRRPLAKVLVTSAAPGEGKSVSAANLAFTLARPGRQRVLLLEGDLHRPALLARMGLRHEGGLADWLEQRRALPECMARWSGLPLWVLPAGRSAGLPLELLQACSPISILRLLEPHFDWIVIDAPPLLPMADAAHWARAADGVLLVARANHSRQSDLQQGARQLEREKWLGVILNDYSAREHRYYDQYYPGGAGGVGK
jgi:capsular exopolysaccharide synthesis family protein